MLIIITIFSIIIFILILRKSKNEKIKFKKILLDSIPLPLFVKDFNGKYIYVNEEFEKFFNIKRKELFLRKNSFKLEIELDFLDKIILSDLYILKKSNYKKLIRLSEIDLLGKDGKIKKLRIHKSLYKDIDGKVKGILGVIIDTTHQKELEKKLIELSIIDELTKVFNRRYFNKIGKIEIERARRYNNELSIIFFDIDHFKKINDKYGHQVGDLILKELTNLISINIRKIDSLFRIGGEEFVILLINTSLDQAYMVAEKLRKIVEKHEFPVVKKLTVSFGCTILRKDDTLETFLERADEALYKAKNRGRNKVVVL